MLAIAPSASLFAHEGARQDWLTHQPTGLSLLMIISLLVLLYLMATWLRWKLPSRLLLIVAAAIVIGVIHLPHNPTVTAIILSGGFIMTFMLAFTLLGKDS